MMLRILIVFIALMCAGATIGAADAPATQPTGKTFGERLDERVVEFQFDGTLAAAIDSVREKYHLNIVVNWHSLQNNGVEPGTVVRIHMWDVALGQAIDALFAIGSQDRTNIDFDIEGDVLTIGSDIGERKPTGEVQIYDVRDLLDAAVTRRKPDPAQPKSADALQEEEADKLCKLIQDMVDTTTWTDNGGFAVIKCWSGRLFIRQLPLQQRHVEAFLEKIRKEQGKP